MITAEQSIDTDCADSAAYILSAAEQDPKMKPISNLLYRVGIPTRMSGFYYLRDAISLAWDALEIRPGVTAKIYNQIAEKYTITVRQVERAIRSAIDAACTRKNKTAILKNILGFHVDADNYNLTNLEFIALAADTLRINYRYIS